MIEISAELLAIVYASEALVPFEPAALDELEAKAVLRNGELGVTGYLCFDGGRFFQYIEGTPESVRELMARIASDPRHRVLQQLTTTDLTERRFPNWQMKLLRKSQFYGLESLLYDHLVFMKRFDSKFESGNQAVWRIIARIANVQARLVTP